MDMVKRFEVWNIELNPTMGYEINKIRPCFVVSPDEVNEYLKTVIIIPLTSTIKKYPTRIDCKFRGKNGQIAIDQIRAVDTKRLIKKLGAIDIKTAKLLCQNIEIMFKY